jgi:hypothetical protein
MVPDHFRFGGGAAESTLLPLMAVCLLIGVMMLLTFPRERAITPFLLAFFIIPFGQAVVLGGFHFTAMRVLILAGLARRAIFQGSSSRGKYPGGFNAIDRVVVLWSLSAAIMFCLTFMEKQAFINGLGMLLDSLGGYLVVRFLIPNREAMRRAIKTLAAICVIQGVPMIGEQITRINVFGLVTGVPLASAVRNGSVRASGTLGALTAGPFAGIMIPMFFWLWTEGKSRMAALAGIAGATAMVITSNSSTSWMALIGSLVGLAFWRLRTRMRQIRWGLVIMLVGLHLVMKAPVWALIARVDLTGSSSGYQRYMMVDMAIRNFSDWWLMGTPDYVNWGWDSWDLCNQFVAVALTGGLLNLIFYIAIFKRGFGAIGTARKLVNGDRGQEWFFWCLGSTLFATVVTYFGINSVAVLLMGFFVLVACISVATFEARQPAERTAEVPAQVRFASGPGAAGAYVPLGEAKEEARHGLTTRGRERFTSWLKA